MASPSSARPDLQAGPASACSLGCGALAATHPAGCVPEDSEKDSVQVTSPPDIAPQVVKMDT